MSGPWLDPYTEGVIAKYGVTSMQEVLAIKVSQGIKPADAIMAIVMESIEAERAELAALNALALTVTCPYCLSPAGVACIRLRGRYFGMIVAAKPGYHQKRMNAAIHAGLDGAA